MDKQPSFFAKKLTDHLEITKTKKIQKIPRSPTNQLTRLTKGHHDNKLNDPHPDTEVDSDLCLPRFVMCVSHDLDNGNLKEYAWDPQKVNVPQNIVDDLLMLQNVFECKIISPSIYPLIYDSKCSSPAISLRSLEFYSEVINDHTLYSDLSHDDKINFSIGIRDLFIASCEGLLNDRERDLLREVVEIVDPNDEYIICKNISDMYVTPYPTRTNKMVRFIESGDSNSVVDECFIRNKLNLLVGFIDPCELSYHNFENIINLDSLFQKHPTEKNFTVSDIKKHAESNVYTFSLKDENGILLSLDKFGLYTEPINKLSRGGKRFIFSSEQLSNDLTNALLFTSVGDQGFLDEKFQFVNYVFRCNKFQPSDKKFTSHYDTPYFDSTSKRYSKYTLLLYLTSGTADPILNISNSKFRIDTINTQSGILGVIFDQKYEHEGRPFIADDKIFIRTELIFGFEEDELDFDDDISRKFNIACYMTKQSLFNAEVERYASACFDQAAKARLSLSQKQLSPDMLLYKEYKGVRFVTNGYDYWFSNELNLKKIAVLVLLDYFNGRFQSGEPFDKAKFSVVKSIFEYNEQSNDKPEVDLEEVEETIRKLLNIKEVEVSKSKEKDKYKRSDSLVESLSSNEDFSLGTYQGTALDCCDDHRSAIEEMNADLLELRTSLKEEFTIIIFDTCLRIEHKDIMVTDQEIIINNRIPSIHFASNYCGRSVDVDKCISSEMIDVVAYSNIPPILYKTIEGLYHLKIELFNNGFVRKEEYSMEKHYGNEYMPESEEGEESNPKSGSEEEVV